MSLASIRSSEVSGHYKQRNEQLSKQPLESCYWCVTTLQAGIQSQALASAGVGAIIVVGTVIAGSLVDKAGRKQLLIASYLGMAASMAAMACGLAMPQLAVRTSAPPVICVGFHELRVNACII